MSNAIGADIGTYNLVVCRKNKDNDFSYKREVNAFLQMPLDNRFVFNMMKNAGVPLIEQPDANVAYALGEAAVNMAYTMTQIELKRPMKDGCLNPRERHAQQIMNVMCHSLIGDIEEDNTTLYYSVPANAINQETDADYHSKVLEAMFKAYRSEKGYKLDPHPINEALALVYAELQNKAWTGIGVSCLVPGTKIYTRRGLTNIEDVKEGDEVFTHKGRWRTVYDTVPQYFCGTKTKIKVTGYSGSDSEYEFVDNHKLYVMRDGKWNWIGCDDVVVGDIIGEPIEAYNNNSQRPTVEILSRNTCSKLWKSTHYELNSDMCELIGYFLGDGSVNLKERCFQFDFAKHETDNIERVTFLISKVFNKKSSLTKKGENCTRVKCYSIGLAKWFKENCYKDKQKKCPFELCCITDEESKSLLCGMIKSDGMISESHLSFFNSNSHLAHVCKQLFARCGIASSLDSRDKKSHLYRAENRVISTNKKQFTVNSGCQLAYDTLQECLNFTRKTTTKTKKKMSVLNGFVFSKIKSISNEPYVGMVHDLRVAEDHSFCAPNLTISNCGAGMVNLCYAMYGAPISQFSLVNSGDWIDKMASKAIGEETTTYVNREKMHADLTMENPDTIVQRAIKAQYEIMIQHTVSGIKKGIEDAGNKARSEQPIDIVVAGGTSMPKGFDVLFRNILEQAKITNMKIGEVIRPADPLYSVARGCLIAAENAK